MKFSHSYEIELDPDEAGLKAEDFQPGSILQDLFQKFGPGPVVALCRARGGERLNIPTLEYVTKPARSRRHKKLSIKS